MDDKKFNILYVDDEPNNLVSFKASFRSYYNIYIASNGKEAIEIMKNENITLIICDQRMPEMTGVSLLEQLVPEFPDTIRMVLTAYSDVDSIINAINKGKIYQFITKPWNLDELKIIIDNALNTYQLRNENKDLIAERTKLQFLNERQQKENILSQLETLKNQVNPHFLFNCLNTLSALVHEDAEAAEKFILKLTNVYRYVLEQKDNVVVKLEDELTFMRSFFFLQKIRFGDNIHLEEKEISPLLLSYHLPPLAMQLLVENAIKHNIVSRDLPLTIEISADENKFLTVKNTYQKKENSNSTGIGQYNLKERYSFITHRKPEFFIHENNYYAKLPLIKNLAVSLNL
jgi:CheY-like chemotaxis protein